MYIILNGMNMSGCQIKINSKKDINLFIDKLINKFIPPYCICLIGPLGVGKTYFSKYLIKKLCGSKVNVSSPTFSLVNIYDSCNKISKQPIQIWHFDLYRIVDEEEVLGLGLEEALNNIVIIEWANKLQTLYPKNSITIQLEFTNENKRFLKANFNIG